MNLYVFKINGDYNAVEGTNFYKALSFFFPLFDKDKLLDPREVSKDGSLHEGTKIRSYLLKQENVQFVDVWKTMKECSKDLIIPHIVSSATFGMYKRNESFILYCGDFIDKCIQWLSDHIDGEHFDVHYITNLKNIDYDFSYLNKVKDNELKKYSKTPTLF